MEELKLLIHQAQTGDPQSFAVIVQRFQDMAVGYAYSVLGDFHLAEDTAQKAFIQAYADLSKLKEPSAFPGWFRQIVFTHCSRFTRRKRVQTSRWEEIDEMAATGPDPFQAMEVLEMKKIVREAIHALAEPQRQVMTLFYISDYSQKEIARFLEVPLTTVQKRLHDARRRLKERMLIMVEDDLQENRPSKDDRFVEKVLEFIAPDKKEHGEKIYDMIETDTPSVDPYLGNAQVKGDQTARVSKVTAAKETEHTIRGGQEIAQLIVGTDPPHEVARMNGFDLSGDAGQLIDVLFPAQDPQMRNQDL
jgi:RNA polymerase sigma factor (sigma-70 family)